MDTYLATVDIARSWLGTPFALHGRSKSGCDCVGLIIGVACELKACYGIPVRYPTKHSVSYSIHYQQCIITEVESYLYPAQGKIAPGLIAILTKDHQNYHMGIIGDYKINPSKHTIIHACLLRNTVIEHRLSPEMTHLICGTYTIF